MKLGSNAFIDSTWDASAFIASFIIPSPPHEMFLRKDSLLSSVPLNGVCYVYDAKCILNQPAIVKIYDNSFGQVNITNYKF